MTVQDFLNKHRNVQIDPEMLSDPTTDQILDEVWYPRTYDPLFDMPEDFSADKLTRSGAHYQKLNTIFSTGDFSLAFPEDMRSMAQVMFNSAKDPLREKKKYSLAYYFSNDRPENVPYLYTNIDTLLRNAFGRETSVDEAYSRVAEIIAKRSERIDLQKLKRNLEISEQKAQAMQNESFIGRVADGLIETYRPDRWGAALKSGLASFGKTIGDTAFIIMRGNRDQMTTARLLAAVDEDVSKMAVDVAEKTDLQLEEAEKKFNEDMLNYISEKNRLAFTSDNWINEWNNGAWIGNAARFLLSQAPTQAAQFLLFKTAGPSAPTLIGIMSANSKFTELRHGNPDMAPDDMVKNAVTTGLINAGAAWTTMGLLKGKIPFFKSQTKSLTVHILSSIGIEASQEFAEQLSENGTDIFTGVYGDWRKLTPQQFQKLLFAGTKESALAGGFFGGLTGATAKPYIDTQNRIADLRKNLTDRKHVLLEQTKLSDRDIREIQNIDMLLDSGNDNDMLALVNLMEAVEQMAAEKRTEPEMTETEPEMTETEPEMTETEPEMTAKQTETVESGITEDAAELDSEMEDVDYDPEDLAELDRKRDEAIAEINVSQILVHNPQDTAENARSLMALLFPAFNLEIFTSTEDIPGDVRSRIEAEGFDVNKINAWIDSTDTVYLNAAKVRPSQVGKAIGHEVIGHRGLSAVFGKNYDALLDQVFKDHSEEITRLADTYKKDPGLLADQRYLTEEFLGNCANAETKPSWWKEFLGFVRSQLRKILPGMHFTDTDIEAALSRSARAMRKKVRAAETGSDTSDNSDTSDGLRFAVDGKYFKKWQDVIEQFKKDLEGVELDKEQQDIYDVVLQQKDKISLRINDLNELEDIFVSFGTRKKGIKKLISVHYAGLRNPVTALEVLNIGDVIRRGTLTEEGTAAHPSSRKYELKTKDGATLKVIVDFSKKNDKNKSVINFYSDRKSDTGAHNVSSGIIADYENNISPFTENASGEFTEEDIRVDEHIRFSVAPEDENLIVMHNVTAAKLRKAAKLGGLPVPSLAIVDAEKSDFDNFGEISLIADKSLIDPKIKNNKVYNADIYSPRMPEVKNFYSDEDYAKAVRILKEYDGSESDREGFMPVDYVVDRHRKGMVTSDLLDNLPWDTYAVINWYCQEHGIETPKEWRQQSELRNSSDFRNWWETVGIPALGLDPEAKMYGGTTNSGRQRWLPLTLENVVAAMTKKVRSGEGFFYGIGNIRSMKAKQFKSIAEIQKQRGNIVDPETMKNLKEEVKQELEKLSLKMQEADLQDDWHFDTAEDCLMALAEGGRDNISYLHSRFGDNMDIFREMAAFLDKLVNMPTEYFEAKPQRAVGVNEFRAAVVPEDLPADVRKILEDAGLEIYTYGKTPRKAALQMATMDNELRFSMSQENEIPEGYTPHEHSNIVDILRPFLIRHHDLTMNEYSQYLKECGVDIAERDVAHFVRTAELANAADARKRRNKIRDEWLYENVVEYKHAVDFAGSKDFKISLPEELKDHSVSGTFWASKKDKGAAVISLDELAEYIARQTGRESLTVRQELFDFYNNLTLPALRKYYTDFKNEMIYADKEAARRDMEEFMHQQQARIEDEVLEIISRGEPIITTEWISQNRPVYKELYKQLHKNVQDQKIPHEPSKTEIEAMNAALRQESGNAADYAEAYKAARIAAYNEYRQRSAALRDKVMKSKADAVSLQREAIAFAEKHIPPEYRGEFTRQIVSLLDYSTTPTARYPEGRRDTEFRKLISAMTERAGAARKNLLLTDINEMLNQYRINRSYKGIPVSKAPAVQNDVTEISRILKMTAGALNVYRSAAAEAMSMAEIDSPAWLTARRKAELSEIFGNLDMLDVDAVQKAKDHLKELVLTGRAELKTRMTERLSALKAMRAKVIDTLTHGIIDTRGTDADKFNNFLLKNRTGLESLLRLVAFRDIENFDRTALGQLVKDYTYAQEKEKTVMRKFDNDLRRAVKEILGYSGKFGWNNFIKHINSQIKGITRTVYHAEVEDDGRHKQTLLYKRPAIRVKVNYRLAEYVLLNYRDELSKVFKIPGVSFAKKDFAKYGEIKDEYAVFGIGENKYLVVSLDADNGTITEFEVPSQAIDRRYYVGYNLSDIAKNFANKQIDDVSAGVVPVTEEFADSAADAQYHLLNDGDKAAALIEFAATPRKLKSSVEEISDLTINNALQLILEWEQLDYKDAFIWNGLTEKTMQQLYNAVGENFLKFAHWMRDYIDTFANDLDRVAREKYGVGLPRIVNYFPGAFQGTANQRVSDGNPIGKSLGAMSMNPSFLIARKGHLKAPDLTTDALSMFISHIFRQTHFVENNDVVSTLRGIFNDAKVKQAINQTLGRNVTDDIIRRIAEYAAGGGISGDSFGAKLSAQFIKFFAPAKIALSIPTGLKQAAGSFAYMYNVPVKDFVRYTGRAYSLNKDFLRFAKYAWNSDFFKNRLAGGMDKDLVHIMNRSFDTEKRSVIVDLFFSDIGALPMQAGDAFATIVGGYSAYAYGRDQALAQGATPEEAHKAGEYYWMKSTDETQQGRNITSQNYFMANPTAWRTFTLFRSNAMQTMDLVLRSIDEVRFSGSTAARKKLARQLLVSHVIIPFNMFLVSQLWRKGLDWEEWEWDELATGMLFGSWEGLILADFFKSAIEKILRAVTGKPVYSRGSTAVQIFDDTGNVINDVKKILGDKELTTRDYASAVQSLGSVLMVTGLKNNITGAAGSIIHAAGMRSKQIIRWFEDKNKVGKFSDAENRKLRRAAGIE